MSLMVQNFILFQIGWFSCVLGGSSMDFYWLGIPVVTVILAVHINRASNSSDEVKLILATTLIGTTWDSGLMAAGLFAFSNGVFFSSLIPFWMIAMWALFASTLNVSLGWLKQRYWLAALFGAAGGPLAYYAGHRLGAIEFSNMSTALVAVGAGWAVIMPLLTRLAARFNGYQNLAPVTSYEVKTV